MEKQILIRGNEAIGEGAIQSGCRAYFGYPITPQNELIAYMAKRMFEIEGVFIQAESEIAAINMVFGASLTGVRTMTSSSSPGISLKQEGISYMAACQLPGVIVNVQRGGPGLGNIAGSQGDYFQATRGGGHGDYRTIVLAPYSVQEMFDLTCLSFQLADKYRNPVILLSDGIVGQMLEPIRQNWDTNNKNIERKVRGKDWVLNGCKGREPRMVRSLLMEEGKLEELNLELSRKYKKMEEQEVRVDLWNIEDAEIIIVAYGIAARIGKTVIQRARRQGLKVGMIRPITLWPFPIQVIKDIAQKAKSFLVIEMSLGQMVEDVRLAIEGKRKVHFCGRPGGSVLEVDEILDKLREISNLK